MLTYNNDNILLSIFVQFINKVRQAFECSFIISKIKIFIHVVNISPLYILKKKALA